MCYVHSESIPESSQKELSEEQWLELMKQAVSEGIYSVTLSGGEAMLHPGFWPIYEYLHAHGVLVSVFTNGLCLTDTAIEHFVSLPPRLIQISLYGASEEGYTTVTGRPVFHQIDHTLQQLKKAGLPFQVAITPSIFLYPEIDSILQYVQERNYPYRINKTLFPPREETGRKHANICLSTQQMGEILKQLPAEGSSEPGQVHRISIPKTAPLSEIGVPCASGMTSAHIDCNGIMNGCIALPLVNADVCKLGLKELFRQFINAAWNFECPQNVQAARSILFVPPVPENIF
ncbi:MAG: radical SAM protein [Lachnospiraceae bacterium]|nr:radical SAM protein [Lachnospiraceae bacterium]